VCVCFFFKFCVCVSVCVSLRCCVCHTPSQRRMGGCFSSANNKLEFRRPHIEEFSEARTSYRGRSELENLAKVKHLRFCLRPSSPRQTQGVKKEHSESTLNTEGNQNASSRHEDTSTGVLTNEDTSTGEVHHGQAHPDPAGGGRRILSRNEILQASYKSSSGRMGSKFAKQIIREAKLASVSDKKKKKLHIRKAKQALKSALKYEPDSEDLAHLTAVVRSLEHTDVSSNMKSQGSKNAPDGTEPTGSQIVHTSNWHLHERLVSHLILHDREDNDDADKDESEQYLTKTNKIVVDDGDSSVVSSNSSNVDPLNYGFYETLDPTDGLRLLADPEDDLIPSLYATGTQASAKDVKGTLPDSESVESKDNSQWLVEQCQALRRRLEEEKKERQKVEEKLHRAEDAASKLQETLKRVTIGEELKAPLSTPKKKGRAARGAVPRQGVGSLSLAQRGGVPAKPGTPTSYRKPSHDGSISSSSQGLEMTSMSKEPGLERQVRSFQALQSGQEMPASVSSRQVTKERYDNNSKQSTGRPASSQLLYIAPIHFPGVTPSVARSEDFHSVGDSSIISSNSQWGANPKIPAWKQSGASVGLPSVGGPSVTSAGNGSFTFPSSPPVSPTQPPLFEARELAAYRERRISDLQVRVMNGVSEEEIARFAIGKDCFKGASAFFMHLDRLLQDHAGHPLTRVHWLKVGQKGTERRHADMRMLQELINSPLTMPLYLCTVPMQIPAELALFQPNIRLKSLVPAKVVYRPKDLSIPRVFLETTRLPHDRQLSVAFTDQWTNTTYVVEGLLSEDLCGVHFGIPTAMLQKEVEGGVGLYDVHLIIDNIHRSENRRALAVVNSDRAMSSDASSASFEPVL